METLLKSEFAARLRVSKARVSQMIQMGLPLTADGKVEVSAALNWIETHIDISHKDSAARRSDAAARRQSDAVPSPAAPTAAGLPDPGRILLTAKAKRALVDLRRAERMERLENDELIEAVEVSRAIDGLIAEAPCRPTVAVRRFVGQDQVQALQELLQVDLKIGTRLDALHRADSGMLNRHFCARAGKRPGRMVRCRRLRWHESAARAAGSAPPGLEAP
jgi:hypothetical protein